tara:strand:- start:1972 stop:2298 length:327 start_codon:yes stop_codon:yes gene_type:complete
MNHAVAHVSTGEACWDDDRVLGLDWLWRCVWLLLIISLFALVYLNFSIRVGTARLNALMGESSRLMMVKDSILLEKERLQMHHTTEKNAKDVLNYRLAKKNQVVNITV